MKEKNKVRFSISTKLLRVLVPIVAISIILMTVFTALRASNIIENTAERALSQEGRANAESIGGTMSDLRRSYDMIADTMEKVAFQSDDELLAYLGEYLTMSELTPNGIYAGLEDGTWLDPSGWEPDEDYVITERDWYRDGLGKHSLEYGDPYLDSDTGEMIVSMSREISLKDGRKGVAAVDINLTEVMEEVSQFSPMGSGMSMMLDGENVLSYYLTDYNGTKISEHPDDSFLTMVAPLLGKGNDEVQHLKVAGTSYYLALSNVPGTTWTLVSSIAKSDILKELQSFMVMIIIVAIVISALIGLLIYLMIRKIVTRPVKLLTENIESIADGDFTINIDKGGNDEIGLMNSRMSDFIASMRGTLTDMKDVTERLSMEAGNSRAASEMLNRQASNQSMSMDQIHQAMEGVAMSVTELATNATELARQSAMWPSRVQRPIRQWTY